MRTIRLILAPLLAAALVSAACSGGTNPLEPQESPELSTILLDLDGLLGKKFLSCSPLPAQSRSASIGFMGGVIRVGPHKLVIPPGAVPTRRTITARITAGDTKNSIQFSPEGLRFRVPSVLSISYANCSYGGLLSALQFAYTTDNLRSILELLPAAPNPLNKTVNGSISHFSRYAVAF